MSHHASSAWHGLPSCAKLAAAQSFLPVFLLRWLLRSCTVSRAVVHRKLLLREHLQVQPARTFASVTETSSLANGYGHSRPDNTSGSSPRRRLTVRIVAVALLFGGPLAVFRALLAALPPDFSQRWQTFFEEYSQREPLSSCRTEKKSCILYDRHGEVITSVTFTSKFNLPLSVNKDIQDPAIPTILWQAVVACEDRRFFRHPGIDPRGLARAALSLSTNGGGSTITQQLVKNVFLNSERKWNRKLMEMFLALILESRMSKWDILQAYLKKIYWGHGNFGVVAAAEFYFGKHISHLNVGECAMLAGMIPAPEVFSPFRDATRGKRAQGRALCRMVEVGVLDASHAAAIVNEPLELTREGEVRDFGPCKAAFFVDEVLKVLIERYGYKRVSEGGLKIHTTLDLEMQELAEKIVNERLSEVDLQQVCLTERAIAQTQKKLHELQVAHNSASKEALDYSNAISCVKQSPQHSDNFSSREEALQSSIEHLQQESKLTVNARLEAALVSIDHSDGGVRVLIGGRGQAQTNLNRSTQVYRSPGSTFRPVIYLTALRETSSIRDLSKDDICNLKETFSKESFGKRYYDLSKESCESLSNKLGAEKVYRMGKSLGAEPFPQYDSKLGFEGLKVTAMQLANVYATIGSGGLCHKPFFVTRVETEDGTILEENKISGVRVVEAHQIRLLKMLLQVQQQGGGRRRRSKLRSCVRQIVASDGDRDAWCAGFTRDMTSVVWLGYDDHDCAGLHFHPGFGVNQASQIWKDSMALMPKDQQAKQLRTWHLRSVKISRSTFQMQKH